MFVGSTVGAMSSFQPSASWPFVLAPVTKRKPPCPRSGVSI